MSFFKTTAITDVSKRNYDSHLTKWLSFTTHTLHQLIMDPPAALAILHAAPIKQTNVNLHGYYSAIGSYIKHEGSSEEKPFFEKWKAIAQENSKPLMEHYKKNEPTEIQKGIELDLADVVKKRDALPLGMDRLLLGFYTYIPAMRADYFATRIVKEGEKEPEEGNYIQGSVLIIQDYKTKRHYGAIRTPIPEPLLKELEASLKDCPRDYLFVKRDGKEAMSRAEFSAWANRILTRLFEKRTTLTALRHATSTSEWKDVDIKAKKEKSASMGHSVGMSMAYVWK
uniref:Tyr recombinase domain-containing protein n=1 Tax=viral metagenome TaxID=1070528 RepID=A0A6C0K3C4_9ZZZZ